MLVIDIPVFSSCRPLVFLPVVVCLVLLDWKKAEEGFKHIKHSTAHNECISALTHSVTNTQQENYPVCTRVLSQQQLHGGNQLSLQVIHPAVPERLRHISQCPHPRPDVRGWFALWSTQLAPSLHLLESSSETHLSEQHRPSSSDSRPQATLIVQLSAYR